MQLTENRFQTKKLWYLKQIKVFAELSWQELQELHRTTPRKSYRKNELISLSGEPKENIYLLKEGQVRISKMSQDGRESTVAILETGEIFGTLETVDTLLYESMVEAIEPVTVCEIQRNILDKFLQVYPKTGGKTLKFRGGRLQQIETRASDLIFKSASVRLASLLLALSERMGELKSGAIQLPIRLSHQNLANLIGSSAETVSTLIRQFGRYGLLEQNHHYIRILDKDKLANVK